MAPRPSSSSRISDLTYLSVEASVQSKPWPDLDPRWLSRAVITGVSHEKEKEEKKKAEIHNFFRPVYPFTYFPRLATSYLLMLCLYGRPSVTYTALVHRAHAQRMIVSSCRTPDAITEYVRPQSMSSRTRNSRHSYISEVSFLLHSLVVSSSMLFAFDLLRLRSCVVSTFGSPLARAPKCSALQATSIVHLSIGHMDSRCGTSISPLQNRWLIMV